MISCCCAVQRCLTDQEDLGQDSGCTAAEPICISNTHCLAVCNSAGAPATCGTAEGECYCPTTCTESGVCEVRHNAAKHAAACSCSEPCRVGRSSLHLLVLPPSAQCPANTLMAGGSKCGGAGQTCHCPTGYACDDAGTTCVVSINARGRGGTSPDGNSASLPRGSWLPVFTAHLPLPAALPRLRSSAGVQGVVHQW